MLTPPNDAAVYPTWVHSVYWSSLDIKPATDESVQPVLEAFLRKENKPVVLPYVYPEVDRLVVRRARYSDVPSIVDLLVQGNSIAPQYAPQLIKQLIDDPWAWPMLLEWRDKPLQFETIVLGPDTSAYIGYLVHFNHELSQWFWGACERPMRDWLVQRGYKTMRSLMRKDRAVHRMERVEQVYGVHKIGETDNYVRLEWNLEGKELPTWPKRRTAGSDWKFEYKNLVFREMQESELPEIQRIMKDEFIRLGFKNGNDAMNIMEERWHLERASILLGYVDGKLRFARSARQRTETQAAVTMLHPMVVDEESKIATYAGLLWAKALGYTGVVSFLQPEVQNSVRLWNYLNRVSPHIKKLKEYPHFKGTVTEVGTDQFDSVLSLSVEQWLQSLS